MARFFQFILRKSEGTWTREKLVSFYSRFAEVFAFAKEWHTQSLVVSLQQDAAKSKFYYYSETLRMNVPLIREMDVQFFSKFFWDMYDSKVYVDRENVDEYAEHDFVW